MSESTLDISGVDEVVPTFTEIGRSVEQLEQLAQKLGVAMGALDQTLGEMSQRVDKAASSLEKTKTERKPDPAKEAALEQQKRAAEEQQLRAKMAQMVGGGINYAAYEQQLKKLRDQMDLISQASERQVISHKEALEAQIKLKAQYGKLWVEAKSYAAVGGGGLGRIAAQITNRVSALPEQAMGAAKNQISGIGTGIMGLVMSTPIAGGLFGLMMHGVMNRDRINAETGEIVNIAVAAGGKLTQSTTSFLGGFQQQAEHYFGISRQEVQGVLKTFVDAGVSIEDIMKKQKDNLGLVGHDVMTLTLAIDKHFELASGTSARTVVGLMHDYGMSVEAAGDLYEKLAFAGSRSGMGVQNFLTYVQQGAGALKQYGAGVENVAGVLLKLQERYESLGVPKQLAGSLAGQGLGQITQGISSMSNTMQAYMGERMGMGTGLDARMNFRDGMARLSKEGASNEFLSKNISELYKMAMESSGGDKTQARFFLEQQGFGFEGAKAIMEIGDHVDKGGKLTDLSIKEQKALKDAFKTEGQKQSDIQKNIHTIMQGMAQVGEGILQIVTNFVAVAIVFFKTMPALLFGTDDEKKATMDVIKGFWTDIGQGAQKMWGGAKGIGQGVMGLIKPIIGPLEKAIGFNPYEVNSNVSTFRVGQAGQAAEQAELDSRFKGHETGKELRKLSDKMAQSSSGTARSMSGVVDDLGLLMTGMNTAVMRADDWLKDATGLGENKMKKVREDGMRREREVLAAEDKRRQDAMARAQGSQVKVTAVVKQAPGHQRPATPPQ
jgi:hypothetical protein